MKMVPCLHNGVLPNAEIKKKPKPRKINSSTPYEVTDKKIIVCSTYKIHWSRSSSPCRTEHPQPTFNCHCTGFRSRSASSSRLPLSHTSYGFIVESTILYHSSSAHRAEICSWFHAPLPRTPRGHWCHRPKDME